MAEDGREKRGLRARWRARRERRLERAARNAESAARLQRIHDAPTVGEQAVRSGPLSGGGQISS
jgi:hypothetical protein